MKESVKISKKVLDRIRTYTKSLEIKVLISDYIDKRLQEALDRDEKALLSKTDTK